METGGGYKPGLVKGVGVWCGCNPGKEEKSEYHSKKLAPVEAFLLHFILYTPLNLSLVPCCEKLSNTS